MTDYMRVLLYFLSLILLSSCGVTMVPRNDGSVSVSIDSYGKINLRGKTYCLVDSKFSLEFPIEQKELINDLERVFYLKGAKRINDRKSADLIIVASMGISDPISYKVSVPVPIWGATGIASVTTNSNANIYALGNSVYGNGSSTTRYNYNYGITGISSVERNVTEYVRHCNLFIYDNKNKSQSPISKINIESIGSGSDLRRIFPYMTSAALPFIGSSIGKKATFSLALNSPPLWLTSDIIRPVQNIHSNCDRGTFVIGAEFYSNGTRIHLRTLLTGSTWMRLHPKTYLIRPNGSTSLMTNTSAAISPNKLAGNGFENWQVYDFVIDFQPGQVSSGVYGIIEPKGWGFAFRIE